MNTRNEKSPFVIQITRAGMGSGDPALQMKLIQKYLTLLNENETLPSVITFYNDGVKLVVEGSPVLNELATLEQRGVRLIVCNTCLNHYSLSDQLRVGIIGGMTDMIEAQWRAEKVITL